MRYTIVQQVKRDQKMKLDGDAKQQLWDIRDRVLLFFRLSNQTEYLCLGWFSSFSQFPAIKIIVLSEQFFLNFFTPLKILT